MSEVPAAVAEFIHSSTSRTCGTRKVGRRWAFSVASRAGVGYWSQVVETLHFFHSMKAVAMLEIGQKAPAVSLKDHNGQLVKLADFSGKNVVVYFYPKDDTPGCTIEACAFRDEHSKLVKRGAVVLGVSPDDEVSHRKFIGKFNLPFPLLVDKGHTVAEAYGAWGERNMYGKKYMGIIRSTFLIGPDGKIRAVWPKVKPEGHAEQVLAALDGKMPKARPSKKASPKSKAAASGRSARL